MIDKKTPIDDLKHILNKHIICNYLSDTDVAIIESVIALFYMQQERFEILAKINDDQLHINEIVLNRLNEDSIIIKNDEVNNN